jgi:hypothetical protein
MKLNKWTVGLVAVGAVSFGSVAQADESEMSVIQSATSGVTIGGYVSTSFRFDGNTATGGNSADALGTGKANGFNLDVVNLTIEKPLDESEWAAGYKAELLFGPDAAGVGTSIVNSANNAQTFVAFSSGSDIAIKQAYVNLRAPIGNGLEVKMGVFDTIIGYESFNANANPNYTRSLAWSIEPTQHTGVLAIYRVSDIVSVSAGLANRWDAAINGKPGNANNQQWDISYLGSVAVTAPEDMGVLAGSSLYAGVVYGQNAPNAGTGEVNNTTSWYLGATLATGVEGLSVGGAIDYRDIAESQFGGAGIGSSTAVFGGYASFQATEKLSLHGRLEYATVAAATDANAWAGTITGQYDLWQNVISRLEYRWDQRGAGTFGDSGQGPTMRNAHLIALNVIYQF